MPHTGKDKKICDRDCEAFDEKRLSVKLPYHDEYLEKLKLRHRELTLLNDLLKEKVKELLKESS